MNFAIIPARGGSKRIPHKNIKLFYGRPIMAYSIAAALESGLFSQVVVSTDDEEIAQVAIQLGATVPFLRPPELSGDLTPTLPVIKHAVESLEQLYGACTHACCIYPAAPFVRSCDLQAGHASLVNDSGLSFAMSVTSFPFPIQRALKIGLKNRISMFHPEHETTRSQDLTPAFHDAGQFYWGTAGAWKNASGIYSSATSAVLLPRTRVQDIDTLEDWHHAEALFRTLHFPQNQP
ncbi:MAG: pseudaminic acid cytidylyltransferase [Verrucomicrobia bacterium]|nr:pseudaminic acid cytidylyltransferase [Verrucomicrobiota bacterium]